MKYLSFNMKYIQLLAHNRSSVFSSYLHRYYLLILILCLAFKQVCIFSNCKFCIFLSVYKKKCSVFNTEFSNAFIQ